SSQLLLIDLARNRAIFFIRWTIFVRPRAHKNPPPYQMSAPQARRKQSHTDLCEALSLRDHHPLDTPQGKHYSMEALRTMFQISKNCELCQIQQTRNSPL